MEAQNMGIGKLGRHDLIVAKQNRWTIESAFLDSHVCKAIEFDYVNNNIDMTLLDVIWANDNRPQPNSLAWLDRLKAPHLQKEETLIFKTYDGVGTILYSKRFEGLFLLSHYSSFDYNKADAAIQNVKIRYQNVTTKYFEKPKGFGASLEDEVRQMSLNFLNKMNQTAEA